MKLYNFNQNLLEEINSAEKAYFLGFFCADGHLIKNRNGIQFRLAIQDRDILEKINKLFSSNLPIKEYLPSGNGKQNVVVLTMVGKIFKNNLSKLNLPYDKTHYLEFPTYIQENLMSHFIRGYFDGDGWITFFKRKNPQRLNKTEIMVGLLSTKNFIEGLSKYLKNKQIKHHIGFRRVKTMDLWRLQISGSFEVLKFLDFIYKDKGDMFLERKFNKFQKLINEVIPMRKMGMVKNLP